MTSGPAVWKAPVAPTPLPEVMYEPIVRAALLDDLGVAGDVTSEATIPAGTQARAHLTARKSGVLAGLDAALLAFRLLDPNVNVARFIGDGERLDPGARIATIAGEARAILSAERTALNLLSHTSGIATTTARYVAALPRGSNCKITETRKTLPGLRALEKYAVRAGGGANHRTRLDDAILIKDNHIAIAGGVAQALDAAHDRAGHLMKVEIEVDNLMQLAEVLAHPIGADCILLDNFAIDMLESAVNVVAQSALGTMPRDPFHDAPVAPRRSPILEASGGVTLDSIAAIATTGVHIISVGALTHSVTALDIGLDIEPPSS